MSTAPTTTIPQSGTTTTPETQPQHKHLTGQERLAPLTFFKFLSSRSLLTIILSQCALLLLLILVVVLYTPTSDQRSFLWSGSERSINLDKNDNTSPNLNNNQHSNTPLPSHNTQPRRAASTDSNKNSGKSDEYNHLNNKVAEPIDRTGCPIMCPMNYDPICANNGRTFSNACTLHAHNKCTREEGEPMLYMVSSGECPEIGTAENNNNNGKLETF